jgi:hypothetical protein
MDDRYEQFRAAGFRIVEPPHAAKKREGSTYATFIDLMGAVLMQHSIYHEQLDLRGGASEGRATFGSFCHAGRVWKVCVETTYLALETALAAVVADKDPFVEVSTKDGMRLEFNRTIAGRNQASMRLEIEEE